MRRRCCSPRTMTWSRQSRRRVPITRSQYGFCHGECGAVRTCSIPIARHRRTHSRHRKQDANYRRSSAKQRRELLVGCARADGRRSTVTRIATFSRCTLLACREARCVCLPVSCPSGSCGKPNFAELIVMSRGAPQAEGVCFSYQPLPHPRRHLAQVRHAPQRPQHHVNTQKFASLQIERHRR